MRTPFAVLSCCGLLLLVSISTGLISDYYDPGRLSARSSAGMPVMGDINNLENFTLNTSLPEDQPLMKVFILEKPSYGRAYCEEQINKYYPGWLDGPVNVREIKGDNGGTIRNTIFEKDGSQISVRDSGQLDYYNRAVHERWDGVMSRMRQSCQSFYGDQDLVFEGNRLISKSEACNLSIQYAWDHVGLPAGWYVSYQGKWVTSNSYYNYTIVDGYSVRINTRLESRPVIGSDGIRIGMTPLGDVSLCTFLWKDASASKKLTSTRSAAEALAYLDRHPAHCTCTCHGKVAIEGIEIGYLSVDFSSAAQVEMAPVWIFYTNPNRTEYELVDAVGLRFSQ